MIVSYLCYISGWFEAEDLLCSDLPQWKVRKSTRSKVKLRKPFSRSHKGYLQDLSKLLVRPYPLSIATLIIMWIMMKLYIKKYLWFRTTRFTGFQQRLQAVQSVQVFVIQTDTYPSLSQTGHPLHMRSMHLSALENVSSTWLTHGRGHWYLTPCRCGMKI